MAHCAAKDLLEPVCETLAHTDETLPIALARVRYGLSKLLTDEHTMQIMRTMISVAGRCDIGAMFYATGPAEGLQALAVYLERQMTAGAIRRGDSLITVQHFNALIQAEILLTGLLGVFKKPTEQFLGETTARVLLAFLNAYSLVDPPLSAEQWASAISAQ